MLKNIHYLSHPNMIYQIFYYLCIALLNKLVEQTETNNTKDIKSSIGGVRFLSSTGKFPSCSDFLQPELPSGKNFDRNESSAVIKINPSFFEDLSNDGKKSIAFLLKIKQYSINGRVWNYDASTLSKEIGVSVYNIKKHVSFLLGKGYCYINKQGDLVCLSLDKIMETQTKKRKYSVFVCSNNTINDIVDKINFCVLKFSFSRQDYVRRLKRNEQEAYDVKFDKPERLSKGEAKAFLKEYKRRNKIVESNSKITHGELLDYNILGLRRLSVLLNCSTKKASAFVSVLRDAEVIKTQEVVSVFARGVNKNFSCEDYKDSVGKRAGYLFRVGSFVYLHLGTRFEITGSIAS